MFDAGAVMAHLDVETSLFDRKLTASEERVKAFEHGRHEVRISAVFDNASLGQARRIFTQLDQQLSREAMQRLRSSPQGSVLGAINALFSPHPVTGGPSPQQSASQGLLGRMVRAQGGGGGMPGWNISSALTSQAAGSAGPMRIKLDQSSIADIGNAVSGAMPGTPSGPDPGVTRNVTSAARAATASERAAAASENAAQSAASAARDSSDSTHSFLRGFLGIGGGSGGGGRARNALGQFISGGGGGGGGGMRGFSTIAAHAGPFTAGLAGGIGPGILGISALQATEAAGIGAGLGAAPALIGGLSPLIGLGGAAASGLLFKGVQSQISPASQALQKAQQAQAAATTPQQAQAAAQAMASAQQQIRALPAAMRTILKAEQQIQDWWQKFSAGFAPTFARAITLIPPMLTQLQPVLHTFFANALTVANPLILGLGDLARMVLPSLGRAFAAAAPLLRPLLDGLGSLISGLLPGLVALLRASAPAVAALSGGLGQIGRGLGAMLAQFAPVIRASSTILSALLSVLSALFPIVGQLAGIFARALAPVFVQFAGVVRSLLPVITIVGKLFADLSAAILGDLVAAFGALAQLFRAIAPALSAFARALSGVFTLLENSGVFAIMGDALEALVKPLSVMINALLRGLTPILPPLISFLGQMAAILISGLSAAIAALLPPLTRLAMVVLQALAQTLPVLLPLFLSLTKILTAAFVRVVTDLAAALDFVIKAIPPSALRDIALGFIAVWTAVKVGGLVASVSNPVTLIATAVALLVVGIVELVTHWHQVWGEIKRLTGDAWHFLGNLFRNGIVQDILAVWSLGLIPLAEHWGSVWRNIQNWAGNARHFLAGLFRNGVVQDLLAIWSLGLIPLAQHWGTVWNGISRAISSTWGWIKQYVLNPMISFFDTTIPNAFTTAWKAIGRIWSNVGGAVSGPVHWVVQHVVSPLFGFIDDVTNFVGLNRPLPTGAALNFAAGGRITQGTGETSDDVLIRASRNETVLSAAHSRMLAPLLAKIGVPGYAAGGFVNPIGVQLRPGRIDMGVDYSGAGSLFALGSGFITSLYNRGWPGGAFIGLHLDKTPPGGVPWWYYAEDISPYRIGVGQHVSAGQYIGQATGGSTGIEVGYAAPPGTGNTMAAATGENKAGLAHGDPGAYPTGWGVAASNLIRSLGGPGGFSLGQTVQGGTPGIAGGFAGIVRTLADIFGGAGKVAKVLIALATGNATAASNALSSLIGKGAGKAGGRLATTLLAIPGHLISEVVHHLLSPVQGYASGQQGGSVPNVAATGPLQAFARKLVDAMWGDAQWPYFADIVRRESNWVVNATNPSSGAYGIPQALPGSKMASAGADWRTSGYTQLRWMVSYLKNRWKTPALADANEQRAHWYGSGGIIREPVIGFGTRTGDQYRFAEREAEMVTPLSRSRGGPAIGTVYIQLPEGGTVARALTDLNFWLSVSRQQGWAGGMPGG